MSIRFAPFPDFRRLGTVLAIAIALLWAGPLSQAHAQEEPSEPPVDPVAIFQQGQDAHEKGQYKEAIALYEKAIAAAVDFPEAEYQRGTALLSLGRVDDAEKALRRAVQLRPEWTLALANLGSLLVGRGAYPEAEKLLNRAIALNEDNTLAYSALTELKLKNGANPDELRGLHAKLTTITSKAKPPASAWAARGAIEVAIGEKKAAAVSFSRALELDPKNQFALVSKAELALAEGDRRSAETIARTLEAEYPNAEPVKTLRAKVLLSNGRSAEALAILDAIENPSPEVVSLRDKISNKGVEDPAELERRLERMPGDATLLGSLCGAYRLSDPGKALQYCRRASEAEPNNISHAIGFGAALVQAKQYVQAVDLFRKLQQLSPENVTLRANLATALFQLKRYPEAKAEYQWIAQKQPSTAIAYYFLAISHDQLREYMDAMANYQLFLRHADAEKNKLEIEKVNLRLPALQKQVRENKGKRN